MHTFANKFSIALNQNKTEAVLNFYQVLPVVPEDKDLPNGPTDMDTTLIPVANLVLTGECLSLLAKGLQDILQQ